MGTASQRAKTTHSRHPALVAPPAFVVGTATGGAWWNSADTVGATHGGVGPSTDDDVLPGFGGSEAPGLGSDGGRFGGGSGSGSGPIANARGCQKDLSMSFTAEMDVQGPHGGQHTDDWAYRRGGADDVRSPQCNGPSRIPQADVTHSTLHEIYIIYSCIRDHSSPFIYSSAHVLQKVKFVVFCSFGSRIIVFIIRIY
jgi:hypothetical protein